MNTVFMKYVVLRMKNATEIDQDRMGGPPGDVNEEPVTQEKRKKGLRMNCDVGEATEGFKNEL